MTFDERIAKQIKETLKSLDHAEYWLNHHIGNYIRIQRNGVEYIEEPVSYTHLTLPTICSV